MADLLQQLPQLELMCQRLYTAQVSAGLGPLLGKPACAHTALSDALAQAPQERAAAEQLLRVFGQSTDYIAHCKVHTNPLLHEQLQALLSLNSRPCCRPSWTTRSRPMPSCWQPPACSRSSPSSPSGQPLQSRALLAGSTSLQLTLLLRAVRRSSWRCGPTSSLTWTRTFLGNV